MESSQWIERRPDESDRRAKRIWLTPEGRKLEERINQSLKEVHNIAIGNLSQEHIELLHQTISRVRDNLKARKKKLDRG